MPTSAVGTAYAQGGAGAHVTDGPVQVSPFRGYSEFSTPVQTPSSLAVDTIRDTLIKAGWTWTDTVQATAGVSGPFGWGYTSFQRFVLSIGDGTHGTAYFYYDPTTETPPFGWVNGIVGGYAIQAVAVGRTDAQSQQNLVDAINFGGRFFAVADSTTHIALTATAIGTLGNGIVCQGNGSISVASTSSGGGWVLQSRSQQSVELFGNVASMQLTVDTGGGNVEITTVINGHTDIFPLGPYDWRLIADTFQACFMSTAAIPGESIFFNNLFYWCCTPVCDPADGAAHIGNAAFIAKGGNGFTQSLGHPNAANEVLSWVDGVFEDSGQGSNWAIVGYHSESGFVTDLTDQALLEKGLLALKCASGLRFVAYVPDSFLDSKPATVGQQVFQNGRYYRCVATQANPPGSLWLMTDEKVGANPTGGAGLPSTPALAVGTGDITQDPISGLGMLTRTSGSLFTLPMGAGQVTITNIPAGVPVANGTTFGAVGVDVAHQFLLFVPVTLPMTGIKWAIQIP